MLIAAFFARPMALCAPQCVERSDPIARTEATRGPRRLKGLVMSTQGDGEHPAAGSRRRSLGKKYRTTYDCQRFVKNAETRALTGLDVKPPTTIAAYV